MSGHSGGSSGRGDAEHDGPERPRPLPSRSRALLWLHERLFSTLGNTLLSLVLLALIGWLVWTLGKWLLVSADFDVIRTNRRLLLVGRFPLGEEWRIWPIFYGLVVAIGWSWGSWTRATSVAAATLALIDVLVLPVIAGTSGTLDAAPAFGAGVGAYLVAQRWAGTRRGQRRARIVGMGMWVILLPAVIVLLQVRGGVDPALWGGLYLNLIVASGAAIGALPFGILLALARSSSFRVLRVSATVYVELMRGLPLPVMLTLAWLALRHFLPAWRPGQRRAGRPGHNRLRAVHRSVHRGGGPRRPQCDPSRSVRGSVRARPELGAGDHDGHDAAGDPKLAAGARG